MRVFVSCYPHIACYLNTCNECTCFVFTKRLNEEAEYKTGVAGDISASRKKMAFACVSNKKKHTHCTCISHSITVFIELHTIHKRHNNVTEFIF